MSFELPFSGTLVERDEKLEPQGASVRPVSSKFFVARPRQASSKEDSVLSGIDDENVAHGGSRRRKYSAERLSSTAAARAGFGDLVEVVEPVRTPNDLILEKQSTATLGSFADEFRRGDEIRRHGLSVRSKLLFCGPPGCGKTLTAEVLANELKLPLVVARLDAIIASHLGETATNVRKLFDAAKSRSMILFLDEFDALARARSDTTEHSEIRRVVNSLLMMIDRFESRSVLIAATNLEETLDRAIWRRFDEVIVFDRPTLPQISRMLRMKTRNFSADFDVTSYSSRFVGMSYAQIERACMNAIKSSILQQRTMISEKLFLGALEHEIKRAKVENSFLTLR